MDNAKHLQSRKFNLSGALLFGLINDAKDLLLHHLLLIARHYIYTCKQRDTRPNVQMYIQTVQRTVQIERQIAKDHNSLDTFKILPSLNECTILWK